MKRLIAFVWVLAVSCSMIIAQDNTKKLTVFNDFKPAMVYMNNGKVVRTPLANIFLKNASLLFLRGELTMEAFMDPIKTVKIDTLWYVNIDNKLGQLIDSVGNNRLYCVTVIDIDAFKAMMKNNVNITANSFQELVSGSDQISYSTIELELPEDQKLPLLRTYYYLYNGEMIRVHERELSRKLPKSKRHNYESILSLPDFSWVDVDSLMKMLKAISEPSDE